MATNNELPLAQRVLRTRNQSDIPPPTGIKSATSRPLAYKTYSDKAMNEAVKTVVERGIPVRKAALMHAVPKSTLGDCVSGRTLQGATSGANRFLTDDEEEELVNFILGCSSIGYSKTIKDILALVQKTLESCGV